ncbi:hypothetical protein RhiJN_28599 [Ceratobasidium sp. AG-Ba]|nr:hypothetical protein RhiJN_28599 [Ceratobasidium sp. AG-Ba]
MMNSPPSPSPSTPSSGDASPVQMHAEIAPVIPPSGSAPAGVAGGVASPNTAKRRLPSSSVQYGSANRRRREESVREEKDKPNTGERGQERERGELADVELMKWINSIVRDPFDEDAAVL